VSAFTDSLKMLLDNISTITVYSNFQGSPLRGESLRSSDVFGQAPRAEFSDADEEAEEDAHSDDVCKRQKDGYGRETEWQHEQ
jgi:hypothetical protein